MHGMTVSKAQNLASSLLIRLQFSTSIRLLAILIAILLPLALLATYAAQQVSQNAARQRTQLLSDTINQSALRLDKNIASDMDVLTAYANRLALGEDPGTVCPLLDRRFSGGAGPTGALIFVNAASNRPLCEVGALTPGFRKLIMRRFSGDTLLLPDNDGILIQQSDSSPSVRAVAYYPAEMLLKIADPVDELPLSELVLSSDITSLELTSLPAKLKRQLDSTIAASQDVMGLTLGLRVSKPQPSSPEFWSLAIPFIMMFAAALIGWWVVNYMVMRPMSRLREQMIRYKNGDVLQPLHHRPLYAAEILDLENVFRELAHSVTQDKQAIDTSLRQQVALTREVHHRVKNNLQIVASLISLHARTAETPSAAHAYASIQRRVEALSVVHRNHHADTEENNGIDLRALINEVINSFRTSDAGSDFARNATVQIENLNVSQDVAMPIAFLLTEILELLQLSGQCQNMAISVGTCGDDDKSGLILKSDALKHNPQFDALMADGIDRVVLGLSRQLRSKLIRDEQQGTLCIDISVIRLAAPAPIDAVEG